MKYRRFLYCLAVMLVMLPGCPVQAQSFRLQQAMADRERELLVDYGIFPYEEAGLLRLEIYYQVHNAALEFEPSGDLFTADYAVAIKVKDDDGNEVKSFYEEKKATVRDLDQARSTQDYRVNQVNYVLPPGKYKVDFSLSDINSREVMRRDFEAKLEAFDGKYPQLSSLELVQAAGAIDDASSAGKFRKGNLMVIPSLSGSFGTEDSTNVMFYFEIVRGSDSSEETTVEVTIRGDSQGMVYRDSLTVPLVERINRQLRKVALDEFRPDEFELIVSLHGRRYKKRDQKSVDFMVPWTQSAFLRHDYDAALDQLELIVERSEVEPLRDLDDLAERKRAIERFWAEHDPEPGTAVNELRVVFYYRVNLANRLFTHLNRDGWRTDRGRVLIRFGEPDQIDDYPFSPNRVPYQEWHYYKQGRYRKFVFVDVNQDGDYRLQYPYDGLNQRPDF